MADRAQSATILSGMNTKIAFLFPGQGSQTVGMGRELAERFPVAADTFAEADEALGLAISKLCFEGPEDELRLTENTQPAIMTVSVAAWRVLAAHGVQPAMAAGHSLGEWSAHVAAGTLSFADAVRAVKARGRAMQQAVPAGQGAMAAMLQLDAAQVAEACAEAAAETGLTVAAANLNSPGQTVISGAAAAVEKAAATGQGQRRAPGRDASGERALPLRPDAAGAGGSRAGAGRAHAGRPGDSGGRQCHGRPGDHGRRRARRADSPGHRARCAGWIACRRWSAAGAQVFVEVGPGKVLSGLMKQIDPAQKALNVEDAASLEKTLAELARPSDRQLELG